MDAMKFADEADAGVIGRNSENEGITFKGFFKVRCFGADGVEKWTDEINDFPNTIMTAGKNYLLDSGLAASALTTVGPFMGLISSVGYTGAPVAADTMTSHSTWFEVDASTHFPIVAARLTTNGNWSAASGGVKSLTATVNFSIITTGGTIKGMFLVTGTGAVSTLGSTAGTLFCAGVFSGGDRVVIPGDTVQVSYSITAT